MIVTKDIIKKYLRISFIVILLGLDPSWYQMILHSVSQGEVVIPKKYLKDRKYLKLIQNPWNSFREYKNTGT